MLERFAEAVRVERRSNAAVLGIAGAGILVGAVVSAVLALAFGALWGTGHLPASAVSVLIGMLCVLTAHARPDMPGSQPAALAWQAAGAAVLAAFALSTVIALLLFDDLGMNWLVPHLVLNVPTYLAAALLLLHPRYPWLLQRRPRGTG